MKKFLHAIVIVPLIAILTCTQVFGMGFGFSMWDGAGFRFGSAGGSKGILYGLLAANNASNTAPLTALTGTNATQVATSSVVVPNQLGTLITIAASKPAIEGGNHNADVWTATDTGATATVLASGMTRYAGATYSPGGNLGVLAEPSLTNKCTCQKANPTVTTNITKSGDAASVLSIVDDTAALTAAGLIGICTLGDVYKLDNSGGSTSSLATIVGTSVNTNKHSFSIYARNSTGGVANLRFSSGAGSVPIALSTYSLLKSENVTPEGTSEQIVVAIAAGQIVYFILPQLEEYHVATSPIYATPETTGPVTRAARYTTIAGSELGTDFHVDANVKNLGTEMALIGDPTSLAYLYKNSADKVVWRGSSLGADLVDTMNTAAAWIVYDANTVEDDAGAVKVTFVNSSAGARSPLTAAGGLSTNLTVGKTYSVTLNIKVSSGASLAPRAYNGAVYTTTSAVTSTDYVSKTLLFTYANVDAQLNFENMAAGEIVWVKDIVVKEVKELTSTSSLSANTPAIIGVHQGTDGATLYINGTAEATDATMTSPVSWGTTVRIGGNTTVTPGNVLNGTVTDIHSGNDARVSPIIARLNDNIIYLADRKRSIYSVDDLRRAA